MTGVLTCALPIWIALADGPYSPAEREVLTTVGGALQLCPGDTAELLAAAARTPS